MYVDIYIHMYVYMYLICMYNMFIYALYVKTYTHTYAGLTRVSRAAQEAVRGGAPGQKRLKAPYRYTCVCLCTYTYTCINICIYTYVYQYSDIYLCMYRYIYIYR